MKIALGLPHTPWVAERVESFARLAKGLGLSNRNGTQVIGPEGLIVMARIFDEKEPNWSWAAKMWRWGLESCTDWFLTLQDDVVVAPNFWRVLHAMMTAWPGEVIGLEAVHAAGPMLFEEGHRSYTTSDCLIGVAYAVPREVLAHFLTWRDTELRGGAIREITEDTLFATYCLVKKIRIRHPLPTIIDHDTSIVSTYGNDEHANRRPLVRWNNFGAQLEVQLGLELVEGWRGSLGNGNADPPPHLGRFYEATVNLARKWVKGFTEADVARARADINTGLLKRLSAKRRAQRDFTPAATILIATPTRDASTHQEYNATLAGVFQIADLQVFNGVELFDLWQRNADLVRTRSRMVRDFLRTDGTHLWFLDADVSCAPQCLVGMVSAAIRSGREVVCAPYPRRDRIDWKSVVADDGRPPEARAYAYPIGMLTEHLDGQIHEDGCTEVAWMPLGCTLIARSALEKMVEHYRAELEFDDPLTGEDDPTVAIFQLMITRRRLLGEDQSFCERWRAIGGKVWMYLGPGSPATHHGSHSYRGRIETFGIARVNMP